MKIIFLFFIGYRISTAVSASGELSPQIESLISANIETSKILKVLIRSRHLSCGKPEISLKSDGETHWVYSTSQTCRSKEGDLHKFTTAGQVTEAMGSARLRVLPESFSIR